MTHRTSMEVQSALQSAAKLADDANRSVFTAPRARSSEHLQPEDYAAARKLAMEAIQALQAAVSLMDASGRVAWVQNDGRPSHAVPADFRYDRNGQVIRNVPHTQDAHEAIERAKGETLYVFNRRGERVAVSVPTKE